MLILGNELWSMCLSWPMHEAISWGSVKQSLITTSTMEAKFVLYFEATSQSVWLKNFISKLRVVGSKSKSLKVDNDNSATIFLARNDKSESRNKHINIKSLAI